MAKQISIKAGKCNLVAIPDSEKFKVYSLPEKGMLILKEIEAKKFTIEWRKREATTAEDVHNIVIGDQSLERVDTGNAYDRVYLLKNKSSKENHMFWIQDPDTSKDGEVIDKMNDTLTTGTLKAEGTSTSARGAPPAPVISSNDVASILSQLGVSGGNAGAPPSTTSSTNPPSSTTTTNINNPVETTSTSGVVMEEDDEEALLEAALKASMEDDNPTSETASTENAELLAAQALSMETQSTSSTTNNNTTTGGITAESLAASMMAAFAAANNKNTSRPAPRTRPNVVPLDAILVSSKLLPLLEEFPEIIPELLPFLPEGMQTVEELFGTFTSPQLKAACRAFSSALMGDDIASLFANFGLEIRDGMEQLNQGDNIAAFIKAIIALQEREKAKVKGESK